MKINKEFINLLKKKREATIRNLLGRDGLGLVVSNKNGCEKTIDSLNQIDEIFYTLEFLKREKLISIEEKVDNHVIYHIGDCLKENLKKDEIDYLFQLQDLLEKYYNSNIKIENNFFDFIDHWFPFLKYKTEKQREKLIKILLPIGITVLTAVLTLIIYILVGRK